MSENSTQVSHFGRYLEELSNDAGYLTAKDFASALNSFERRRHGLEVITERSVQRWMSENPSPPKPPMFGYICKFLERKHVLVVHNDNVIYRRLRTLWKEAGRRPPRSRTRLISKPPAIFNNYLNDVSCLQRVVTAQDHCEIADIISTVPHDKESTHVLSRILEMSVPFTKKELHKKIERIILECGQSSTERKVAAICANALTKTESWRPDERTIGFLEVVFNKGLASDPFGGQIMLSPLAFDLARMGNQEPIKAHDRLTLIRFRVRRA